MESQNPLVTVVVSTFNGALHLEATLRSIRMQSYAPIEVIVIDDGSTDETLEVARRSGIPAEVVAQPNLGVAVARNRGLARARGRWVGFVDQDDLWHEHRVANLIEYAQRHDLLAVASTERAFALKSQRAALRAVGDGRDAWPAAWIDDGGEDALVTATACPIGAVEQITVERLMEGAAMLTTAVLYDRELAMSAGGFAPHARALDDHILNLNVARIAGPIHRIDTGDLLYRVHPASTSTVSPMAGPFLSAIASVRLGGVFPSERRSGANVEHLLNNLPSAPISAIDQLSLVLLTAPVGSRARRLARWAKSMLGRKVRRSSS